MNNLSSPQGNQLKWENDSVWYKVDCLGFESLAEYVISKLLSKTNIANYVNYNISIESKNDKNVVCCNSHNFLPSNKTCLITLDTLFTKYKDEDIAKKCASFEEIADRIQYVVNTVQSITGLDHFGEYLTALLEMDTLFQNEDRHFNNIAVLYNEETGEYSYAPFFDNGAALYSDTFVSYPYKLNAKECSEIIESKPFARTFDEQIDAAESLYKTWFEYTFTMDDVRNCLQEVKDNFPGIYSDEVCERVEQTLEMQLQKYRCFQKGVIHKSFDSEKPLFNYFATDYTQLENKMIAYMQSHPEQNVSYCMIQPEYVQKIYCSLIRANIPFVGRICADKQGLFIVEPQDEQLLLDIQKETFSIDKTINRLLDTEQIPQIDTLEIIEIEM